MDWILVVKIVASVVLAVVAGGIIWVVEDSIKSYEYDPTM